MLPIDIHMFGPKGSFEKAPILMAEYPTEHNSRMFSKACRVSNDTSTRNPGSRT